MTKQTNYKQTEIGEIPEDWEIKQLQEVADFSNGYAFSSRSFVNSKDDAVPVFKMGNIGIDGGLKITGKEDYASLVIAEKLKNYLTRENDILMCMTDMKSSMNLLGHSARIHYEKFLVNQRVGLIRPRSNVDASYLYYYLNSPKYIERLRTTARSGVQVNLTTEAIRESSVLCPTQDEQQQIASILSSLDDKIELNRRMNRTLEEMGKASFKRWFVDFEFPNENGKPYKSSGGEMVESELGEIPKGWKVKNLGEMLELVYGKGLREGDRQEGQYPVYGSSGVVGNHIQFLVKAPGIVVGRKGNVGSIFWVDNNFFPIDTTYYVRTNQSMYFAYFALQLCNLSNSDSAVPGLSRGQAYMNLLISPEESVLSKYDDIAKPIFSQKKKLKEEIKTLTQIRDSLLPRLMSGKLRVN